MTPGDGAPPYDVEAVRKDFPVLARDVHGDKPLVYLDNAATSQKPRQVLDALDDYYERHNANVHRGMHVLGRGGHRAVRGRAGQGGRVHQRADRDEVVFTKNATEALNLVANMHRLGRPRLAGARPRPRRRDRHHRDGAPLQHRAVAAARASAPARRCAGSASTDDGRLDLSDIDERHHRAHQGRLVRARSRTSSARSTRSRRSSARAHEVGALVVRRRLAGRAAHAARRAGPRRRLRRLHRPQDVRPDRHRRAVGPPRAARGRCRRSSAAAR